MHHCSKSYSNFSGSGKFCLLVELHREVSATNGATSSSFVKEHIAPEVCSVFSEISDNLKTLALKKSVFGVNDIESALSRNLIEERSYIKRT